jgi:hypothetical protein
MQLLFIYKEEHRLRVYENRVLRRIVGPKRDEVTGRWRKLHNDELHNSYSSPSIIRMIKSRRIRWAGHIERMGRRGMHIRYWWESLKKERPLERTRRRWLHNIKMYLGEIGRDGIDCIDSVQDRDQAHVN